MNSLTVSYKTDESWQLERRLSDICITARDGATTEILDYVRHVYTAAAELLAVGNFDVDKSLEELTQPAIVLYDDGMNYPEARVTLWGLVAVKIEGVDHYFSLNNITEYTSVVDVIDRVLMIINMRTFAVATSNAAGVPAYKGGATTSQPTTATDSGAIYELDATTFFTKELRQQIINDGYTRVDAPLHRINVVKSAAGSTYELFRGELDKWPMAKISPQGLNFVNANTKSFLEGIDGLTYTLEPGARVIGRLRPSETGAIYFNVDVINAANMDDIAF